LVESLKETKKPVTVLHSMETSLIQKWMAFKVHSMRIIIL
jgi:hypothetical protein